MAPQLIRSLLPPPSKNGSMMVCNNFFKFSIILTDSFLLTRFRSNTGISVHQLEQTIKLFEEGATVPFIARYRKEKKKQDLAMKIC